MTQVFGGPPRPEPPIEPIRRKHPFTVRCSSCGADIVWFRTRSGKRMPVDESSTRPTDREDQLDLKRHVSHFATCPNANDHRRPRGGLRVL